MALEGTIPAPNLSSGGGDKKAVDDARGRALVFIREHVK
jgi:hypothetical protein